jgi:chemotaxis protein MotB
MTMNSDDDHPPTGAPLWIVTYGDMMSLMLTFFILLVSMSVVRRNDGRFRAMQDAVRQAFGRTSEDSGSPGATRQSTSAFSQLASLGSASNDGLEKSDIDGRGPGGRYVLVRRLRDGNLVTLGGSAAFEGFSAELHPELTRVLDALAEVVRDRKHRIEVRGHTSYEPLPDGSPCRDSFDLSFARARAVADHLVAHGIDRRRLTVEAAGDSEPIRVSRAPTGHAANYRVDVFLLDEYIASPRLAPGPGP